MLTESHPHDANHHDDGQEQAAPGAWRRAMSALTGIGRRKPRTHDLPDPPFALPAPPGETSPDAVSIDEDGSGGDRPGAEGQEAAGGARGRIPDMEERLRRVRRVIEENDPLVPASERPAPAPEVEIVALSVRLATPVDAAALDADPTRSHRVNAAVLAQLPEGARIVALVVETPTA